MPITMRFQLCHECTDEETPHGNFIANECATLAITIISVASARYVMDMISMFKDLDKQALEQQVRDAGLPEIAVSAEKDIEIVNDEVHELADTVRAAVSSAITGVRSVGADRSLFSLN